MKGINFLLILIVIAPFCPAVAVDNTKPTALEIQIHKLVNEERASVDTSLAQLVLSSVLIRVAREHSWDMLNNSYFDHYDLNGKGPADRVTAAGVEWTYVAENLYYSQGYPANQIAQSAVDGWIHSPGHYANMKSQTHFTGIGVASQGDLYYITQVFVEGSKSQLEKIGVIYDNNNLDSLQTDTSHPFAYTREVVLVSFLAVVFFLAWVADKKNKEYRLRRRRRR